MTAQAARRPLAWLAGLLSLYLLFPVAVFFIRLARSHQRGFGLPGLGGALWVSVATATISTAVVALLGVPLAYVLARSRGRSAGLIGIAVQLPLALPPLMSGILLIYLVGPYTTIGRLFHGHLTGSMAGIVLAQTFVAAPFLVIAARSAFASQDPALDDVAATLGHHPMSRFLWVSLPGAGTAIVAGLLLTWLRAFGEYGATVLISYHPYTLPVYTEVQFSGTGLAPTQAPTALALVAAIAVVALSRLRRPARLKPATRLPDARPPSTSRGPAATPVAFDLDATVGTFHLRYGYRAAGHRLAVLGPSGSGKSMTLRALAGLLGPDAGEVTYGGDEVTGVRTEDRRVGYVPQGFGLLPNLTVWRQMCFAPDADAHVAAWWLSTLRLDGLEDRRPNELSGGQRQRVSLARALSRQPRLVLLDEPFSGLDSPVRDELRRELRRLQLDAGLSTVLVTHDPEEAALLADEVVVIDGGRLLQGGPVADVYTRPASPAVARLVGVQNLIAGVARGPDLVDAAGATITTSRHGVPSGSAVWWSVRPEHVTVHPEGPYPARLLDLVQLGGVVAAEVSLADGPELRLRGTLPSDVKVGDECRLLIPPEAVSVWAS